MMMTMNVDWNGRRLSIRHQPDRCWWWYVGQIGRVPLASGRLELSAISAQDKIRRAVSTPAPLIPILLYVFLFGWIQSLICLSLQFPRVYGYVSRQSQHRLGRLVENPTVSLGISHQGKGFHVNCIPPSVFIYLARCKATIRILNWADCQLVVTWF